MTRGPLMQQFCQRAIASYYLEPIDLEETGAYIEHRLRNVEWKGEPPFDPDAVAAVLSGKRGIPRPINDLCDRLPISASLKRHRIGPSDLTPAANELDGELRGCAVAGPRPCQIPYMQGQWRLPRMMSLIAVPLEMLNLNLGTVVDLARAISGRQWRGRRVKSSAGGR